MASSTSSSRSGRRGQQARRLGSEVPRLFTPPLRELTPETSLGFEVIEFATEVLQIWLFPWQRWLLIHALELREDGSFRFRNVIVLVARQNGKSTLSQVLALWWIYVCEVRLVLSTAQDLDTAEEVWQGAVDLVHEEDDYGEFLRPELAGLVKRVVLVNGKKSLDLLTGQRYKIKAANRRAGRGFPGDRIIMDELREQLNWYAWAAITKTTMARPDAQVWCFSNAGDVMSVVLMYLRKMAHRALGDPDGICDDQIGVEDLLPDADDPDVVFEDSDQPEDRSPDLDLAVDEDDLFIAEWSAEPGCDRTDRDQWMQANPSTNHQLPDGSYTLTERTVASACRTDPEWVFRTEVLCQWPEGGLDGPYPDGTWERCAVDRGPDNEIPASERIVPTGRIVACLEVEGDRSAAAVAIAGYRSDSSPQIEIAARSVGTEWAVDWFTDLAHPARARWPIVIRKGSAAWPYVAKLREEGLEVIEWAGPDLGIAWADLFEAVKNQRVHHTSQPVLNLPAATAATKATTAGATFWDPKSSPHPIAPLVAVTGALWWLQQLGVAPPPRPRPRPVKRTKRTSHPLALAGF